MSLNDLMHPRNPYRDKPDFKKLAIKYPEFRSVVTTNLTGNVSINFKDRNALRILTQTLLKNDLNLVVEIPRGTLVPTLPQKFNYLLWIQDLLEANSFSNAIMGIDIGVGASCIHPLLAAKYFHYSMIGYENDDDNFKVANENVVNNGLESNIQLIKTNESYFQSLNHQHQDDQIHFTMCNPPFYDKNDLNHLHQDDDDDDDLPGKDVEMKTDGGEIQFVRDMIQQSSEFKDKIQIFTCMLGHKSSLSPIKILLIEKSIKFTTTEFCQGKTMRWGIAWTFHHEIKLPLISPLKSRKKIEKSHNPLQHKIINGGELSVAFKTIHQWLSDLKAIINIVNNDSSDKIMLEISCYNTNWQNQRRKRREQLRLENEGSAPKRIRANENEDTELQLGCQMFLHKIDDDIIIEMIFKDGVTGREGLNQLLTFIKNKLKQLSRDPNIIS